MPTDIRVYFDADRLSDPSKITAGQYLPWTNYPVFRIPADIVVDNDDGTLRYVWLYDWEQEDQLYNLDTDYLQRENLAHKELETVEKMKEYMVQVMEQMDAPAEQFIRMNLIRK